jgi:RimJ/RimL family protein N-acetyltransferase
MIGLSGTSTLHTARLVLRAPQAGDLPHWEAFASSDRAKGIGGPLTDRLAWRAMCHLTGHWVHRGFGMFVFCDRADLATPLGMAGPWFPAGSPETEIGWSVWAAAAEGKGYAFEAAQATRAFAFGTLGWTTAVSYIAADNIRSIRLAERLGARLDPDAAVRDPENPDLVYRHPEPAA